MSNYLYWSGFANAHTISYKYYVTPSLWVYTWVWVVVFVPFYENFTSNACDSILQYAQGLPRRLFDQMTLPEQWVKVKMFKKCSKMAKYQTCMDNDIKKKLEENFGPLQKLVETTGLAEKELLPMAMRLLHGDMDMI